MEAPVHQFPVPPQPQAVAARALMMAAAAGNTAPSLAAAGREQCPRCASRDTKFCYYNNYNTAQPRHFCRACRRYWTLGGSLRNVPFGGSTRKRPRPARRHTRAMAAAVAAMAMATRTTTPTAAGGGPLFFASSAPLQQGAAGGGGGFLLSSLLLGSAPATTTPLLALGAAPPLLEGRLGFDLGLGDAELAGDLARHQALPMGAGPLPWTAETTVLEGDDRAETTTWKTASSVFPYPPAAALWQELATAAPVVEAGGLHHGGGAPDLLL